MMIEMTCSGGCPRVGRPPWAAGRKSKPALLTPRPLCTNHSVQPSISTFSQHCSVASPMIKNKLEHFISSLT